MKKISIYVPVSGYIEAISPAYRVFNTVNDVCKSAGNEPVFDVEFVALYKNMPVQNGEYSVHVNRLLGEVEQTDLVIVPALSGDLTRAVEANREAIPWIKQVYDTGAEIASLCIGAFLLAATGILDGKKCSTHWAFYEEFQHKFPAVELVDGAIITDQGKVYSSGGANSIWNLLLYLVEKYTTRDMAILVAKFYAIDIDRDDQKAFTIFKGQKSHQDNEILAAQEYIESKYTQLITIEELADHINVSRRSFERRFKDATGNNAMEYVRRVRVEAAKRNFETTRKNITDVMYDVGYTDTKAFRGVFKKITGLTPIEYRNKYNKQAALK